MLFCKNSSTDFFNMRARQTQLIIRILEYNLPILAVGFIAFYYVYSTGAAHLTLLDRTHARYSQQIWQYLLQSVVVTILASGSVSVVATLSPILTEVPQRPCCSQRKYKTLYLCLVTKGLNVETVLRSVKEMKPLLSVDSRVRFVVLTEEGRSFDADFSGVEVILIPHAYQASLATYKARALEYFRIHQKLQDDEWILHMDEETYVDDHCLSTCISFIENTDFEWGQGMIMYNTVNYWQSSLLTFAEVLRYREDLGRFQLQHGRLHFTVWGCHGSFLLTSGRVENLVEWNTSCLAEDFWFADRACKLGFGGGWIPSIAREQNNFTFRDFMNQRRRWFWGMWRVGIFGRLMVFSWILCTLEVPMIFFIWVQGLEIPAWLATWTHLYFSSSACTSVFAMVLQDLDARVSLLQMLSHILVTPLLSVGVQYLQLTTILYSIWCPPTGFDIVQKK